MNYTEQVFFFKIKEISFHFPTLSSTPSSNIKFSYVIKTNVCQYTETYLKKMDRDFANATRLRVNRIALIQQIDTQELIPKLIRARIISADHDVKYINQGTSRIDRARRLIDCLLRKENEHVKRPANWFLLFRGILLENPSIYTGLVTALDNTVIRKPNFISKSQALSNRSTTRQVPQHQDSIGRNLINTNESRLNNEQNNTSNIKTHHQNQITNIEFDRYAMNKVFIEGNFEKIIDNLTYRSQVRLNLC